MPASATTLPYAQKNVFVRYRFPNSIIARFSVKIEFTISSPYDAVNDAQPLAGANGVNTKDVLPPTRRDSIHWSLPVTVLTEILHTIDQNGMTICHRAILAGPV